jgi:hypothetical protein
MEPPTEEMSQTIEGFYRHLQPQLIFWVSGKWSRYNTKPLTPNQSAAFKNCISRETFMGNLLLCHGLEEN